MKFSKIYFIRYFTLSAAIFLLHCCTDSPSEPENTGGIVQTPIAINDGWEVDSPENTGLDRAALDNMIGVVEGIPNHQLHTILIVKDGKLVFERNFAGYPYDRIKVGQSTSYIQFKPETVQFMASVTKSVTSILAGIAIDKGFINSVEDKLIQYYPEYAAELNQVKTDITIHQTLSMTTGLHFDEYTYPYGDSRNDITKIYNSSDPIKVIFSRDLDTKPGTQFYYNSGSPNVIANLISKTSETDFLEFSEKYLFKPLGIKNFLWEKFTSDNYFASGGLHVSARDAAKMGYLFLNKGQWQDKQIISEYWVTKSIQKYTTPTGWTNTNGYGYYWWLNSHITNGKRIDYFYAAGWGEQYMFIVPSENLLAVFTSGYWNVNINVSIFQLFENYVLTSIK